ncbi:MAG: hypothetical protein Fur0042_12660 [Cyanophyceae cyanobacterium]
MSQLYLAAATDKTDFGRFVIYPYDSPCSLYINEGKAIQIDGGYRLLLNVKHCAQEYRSKEVDGKAITFDSHPFAFFDIHSKEWINKGWNGKPDTTVQPTDIELYLCHLFELDEKLRNGFSGEIHFTDYKPLIDLASGGSIDMSIVHERMVKLAPTVLSAAFEAKKEPPIYGAKGGKDTYTAKSEGDKATERLEWIKNFCDPRNDNGLFSDGVGNAMQAIYGQNPEPGYVERFIKLILP